MAGKFRIGISKEVLTKEGGTIFGEQAMRVLDDPAVEWEILEDQVPELLPEHAEKFDAFCLMSARVTENTLSTENKRLKLIARFGVGYDSVDVGACTHSGVMLTITPEGVRRPVAASVMAYILALAHRMFLKDRLVREGRWLEKGNYLGMGLMGRTLGVIGVGNIGEELLRLARPFNMRLLGTDPNVSQESVRDLEVEMVSLEDLLEQSDFVSVNCLLDSSTRGIMSDPQFSLMKPTAYFINTSRGPVVDEAALIRALETKKIMGAAIDVFEKEPVELNNPLLSMENVIVAPHAICHTDECMRILGEKAFEAAVGLAHGKKPGHLVNAQVLEHADWVGRWDN